MELFTACLILFGPRTDPSIFLGLTFISLVLPDFLNKRDDFCYSPTFLFISIQSVLSPFLKKQTGFNVSYEFNVSWSLFLFQCHCIIWMYWFLFGLSDFVAYFSTWRLNILRQVVYPCQTALSLAIPKCEFQSETAFHIVYWFSFRGGIR